MLIASKYSSLGELLGMREVSQHKIDSVSLITFSEFCKLAAKKEWSIEYLAERVKGDIDRPKEVMNRILNGAIVNGKRESLSDVIIQYTVLIELYLRETQKDMMADPKQKSRACACGCGKSVRGRQRLATSACRKKVSRSQRLMKMAV
jgi:hypothetical protein